MKDYSNEMGKRRKGQYPMTRGIRREMMPNTPNAPNGRPNGTPDAEPRQRRATDDQGMLIDPMKGSLNARVDRVMARNPGFNRENVMARQAAKQGMDTGAEGFDPNRLRQPDERQLLAEQRAKAGAQATNIEGGAGTQMSDNAMLTAQGGNVGQPPMGQLTSYGTPQQMGMSSQPMGIPQRPNAAYPNQPQGYQSNIPRRPNAKWYRGGERY